MPTVKVRANFPTPHAEQRRFVTSTSKRNVIRAGRRGGKTTGLAIRGGVKFLDGKRVLYGAPTADQLGRFWAVVKQIFQEPIDYGILRKNETTHIIENPANGARIRAKTCWNADTLRGDYADELILDEWQLMDEDAWNLVGAPMLIDNDGTATFLYTPPGIRNRAISRARDKRHAAKMFKAVQDDPDWATFHFASTANPYASRAGLERARRTMTDLNYRLEILAEDVDEAPTSLWKRDQFDEYRFRVPVPENLVRIVVAVDPTGSKTGDECGIVVAALNAIGHGYVLEDASEGGLSPNEWGKKAVECYHAWRADLVVGETNFGGDMVESTIRTIDPNISFKPVNASRGKAVRAEPVSSLYRQRVVYHCGVFSELEDQMCLWTQDSSWSPDRMDALVWGLTELMLEGELDWGPA